MMAQSTDFFVWHLLETVVSARKNMIQAMRAVVKQV